MISSFLVSSCGECESCSVRGPSAGRRPGRCEFAMQSPVQRCVVALLLLGLCNARKGDPTRSRNVLLIVGEQTNPGGDPSALESLARYACPLLAFVGSCFKKVWDHLSKLRVVLKQVKSRRNIWTEGNRETPEL